jgi:DNA-directed RNA polymerase subunit RPC12/RpoP
MVIAMIKTVKCNICGKNGRVFIVFKKNFSRWAYFGDILEEDEYWECPECSKQ